MMGLVDYIKREDLLLGAVSFCVVEGLSVGSNSRYTIAINISEWDGALVRYSRLAKQLQRKGVEAAVQVKRTEERGPSTLTHLRVADGYEGRGYVLERAMSRLIGVSFERYLRQHPDMPFEDKHNRPRRVLYAIPAFREWAKFMPGALALEPIHDPEQRKLASGKRIDPLTRRLFRHSDDPIGVRTRTTIGAWLAKQCLGNRGEKDRPVRWLSLAGGTGAPSLLMLGASGTPKDTWELTLVDFDEHALSLARSHGTQYNLREEQITTHASDVLDGSLHNVLEPGSFDVVDMMGLFEYLDDDQSAELLNRAYDWVAVGGLVLFANMRRQHPQLNAHKRAAGWPGVLPRSIAEVSGIVEHAGIDPAELQIFRAEDAVYNVYAINKQAAGDTQ